MRLSGSVATAGVWSYLSHTASDSIQQPVPPAPPPAVPATDTSAKPTPGLGDLISAPEDAREQSEALGEAVAA